MKDPRNFCLGVLQAMTKSSTPWSRFLISSHHGHIPNCQELPKRKTLSQRSVINQPNKFTGSSSWTWMELLAVSLGLFLEWTDINRTVDCPSKPCHAHPSCAPARRNGELFGEDTLAGSRTQGELHSMDETYRFLNQRNSLKWRPEGGKSYNCVQWGTQWDGTLGVESPI